MTGRLEPLARQLHRVATEATPAGNYITPVLILPSWCSLRHDFFAELGHSIATVSGRGLRVDCVAPTGRGLRQRAHAFRVTRHLRRLRHFFLNRPDASTTVEIAQAIGRQAAPSADQSFVIGYGDESLELPRWSVAVRLLSEAA